MEIARQREEDTFVVVVASAVAVVVVDNAVVVVVVVDADKKRWEMKEVVQFVASKISSIHAGRRFYCLSPTLCHGYWIIRGKMTMKIVRIWQVYIEVPVCVSLFH